MTDAPAPPPRRAAAGGERHPRRRPARHRHRHRPGDDRGGDRRRRPRRASSSAASRWSTTAPSSPARFPPPCSRSAPTPCSARSSAACGPRDDARRCSRSLLLRGSCRRAEAATASSSARRTSPSNASSGSWWRRRSSGAGMPVKRKLDLGGTFVCDAALRAGQIDVYVEYTGTALTAVLKEPPDTDPARVLARVREAYARGRSGVDRRRSASTTRSRWSCAPSAGVRTISDAVGPAARLDRRLRLRVPAAAGRLSRARANVRPRIPRRPYHGPGTALPRARRPPGRRRRRQRHRRR